MGFADFKRVLVKPHWCEGSPDDWRVIDSRGVEVEIGRAHV